METQRKPDWLKIQLGTSKNYTFIKSLVKGKRLNTVCEEARCPNIHECWGQHRTATFMILGDTCTRRCRFCAIKTGLSSHVDELEPVRVAESVKALQLSHVVITMVNRDELQDGGARILANTVTAIQDRADRCSVEILTSDFMGKHESVHTVMLSNPDIMSHNVETVERLTPRVRSRSSYQRSLDVLQYSAKHFPEVPVKSSIMLGLGETKEEVLQTLDDLRSSKVSVVNIGQYLQPSKQHLPVQKYWTPEEFDEFKQEALKKGFAHCDSAPLVRSSYHAGEDYEVLRKKIHPLYADKSH